MKSEHLTNNELELNFQTNEYIQSITSDNSIIAELGNIILSDGIEPAKEFLTSNHEVFIKKENEINILSKLFRDPYPQSAIQLLLFNIKMHPNSWQAYYELGFTYKLNGDLPLAKETLMKAQELNPENTEIVSLLDEISESGR